METAAGTTNSKFNPHSHCSPSPQPQFPLLRPAGVRVLPLRPVAATLEKKTPREMSPKPRRTFREFIMWTDDLGIMALCCARLESREWMVTSRRWRRWVQSLIDVKKEGWMFWELTRHGQDGTLRGGETVRSFGAGTVSLFLKGKETRIITRQPKYTSWNID